jgi:2,3-bisphosphoglycerate-independent phosphoglycerate mutase
VGSVVANLGLLGYDPHKYFPDGRSYFELLARYDGPIGERDLILRCNTISVDAQDKIADFTAGQIPDRLARTAIREICPFLPSHFELYHGKNYRNALLIRNSTLRPHHIVAFEPHSRIGCNVFDLRIIQGNSQLTAEQHREIQLLNSVMFSTLSRFSQINGGLRSKADMLWFWAPSRPIELPEFATHRGFRRPWLISGSDFLHGIGKAARIGYEINDRFTGESDTDFEGKGAEAVARLRDGADFLFVHVNATDEESHQKDYHGKTRIIEQIDRQIVGPVLEHVRSAEEEFSIVLGGDHYTSSLSGNHLDREAPMVVYNSRYAGSILNCFSERQITERAEITLSSSDLVESIRSGQMRAGFGGRHYDGKRGPVVVKPSFQDDHSKMRRSA